MKKKGFTLVELLAVLIIIALIMVITIPKILDVIETSRLNAAKSSALGFIDAINYNNELSRFNSNYTKIDDGEYSDMSDFSGVKMKGDKPTSANVTIQNEKVALANLCVNNYRIIYGEKKIISAEKNCGQYHASELAYNDEESNLGVDNVQDALDKIATLVKKKSNNN